MKKQNYPKKLRTTVILSDGSQIKLKWLYAKKILKVESDPLSSSLWKVDKPFFKQVR